MSLRQKAWQLPVRLTAGAFILNSGLSKQSADDESAKQLHGFASGTYPAIGKVEPRAFVKSLALAEIALGGALLVPVLPATLVGAGLTAFSLGLVGLYLKTPGMRQEGSLRPTEQGLSLAKDAWLVGIGIGLLLDGVLNGRKKK